MKNIFQAPGQAVSEPARRPRHSISPSGGAPPYESFRFHQGSMSALIFPIPSFLPRHPHLPQTILSSPPPILLQACLAREQGRLPGPTPHRIRRRHCARTQDVFLARWEPGTSIFAFFPTNQGPQADKDLCSANSPRRFFALPLFTVFFSSFFLPDKSGRISFAWFFSSLLI